MPREKKKGMVTVNSSGTVLQGYHITVGGRIHHIMCRGDRDVGVHGVANDVRLHEAQKTGQHCWG